MLDAYVLSYFCITL